MGTEQAILVTLRIFRDMANFGWAWERNDKVRQPDQVWIDSGFMAKVVYAFCRENGGRYRAAIGRGAGQQHRQWYNRPTSTGSIVKFLGEGFHINLLRAEGLLLSEVDADHWKTWVHQRLTTPLESAGAMTLFQSPASDHLAFGKHLTAERKVEEFVAGKGVVVKWERMRKQNHWFDTLYNACAAGHYCGARLVEKEPDPQPRVRPMVLSDGIRRPDGRPWVDLSRWHGIGGSGR